MPIAFACPCGKQFKAKDGSAGRALVCPDCQTRIIVPAPDEIDLGLATDDAPTIPGLPPLVLDRGPTAPAPGPTPADPYQAPNLAPNLTMRGPPAPSQRVVVVDFDMPFQSIVLLMLKVSLAAIPAAILFYLILMIIAGFLYVVLMALGMFAK